ncbi:hypothetical protein [Actinoplanes philippinensis]|uniref:hypothetical protein n=1 Tax=Actinoplanes philippinensis TaxID=35752 RepID=UPI003400501C
MKKSLTFRVMSGVIVASTLLILPATATAAVQELTRSAQAGGEPAKNDISAGPGPVTAISTSVAGRGAAAGARASADAGRLPRAANLPFRVAVPGAVASGVYTTAKGSSQITVTLKVTGRAPCGVFQSTRNGPADGIEWHTIGALCSPGTATFRTSVNRLWASRSLPSIRLCNGDSLGLAEGVDCDDFVPPRGA